MSGQLVDASIVAAPKQRTTRAEKQAIRESRVPEDWQDRPAKRRQKDRDARWTVKTTKAKPRAGESPMVDPAIPEFGYPNHLSTARRHRLIRRWHVFAEQKARMGLFVRTTALARATTKSASPTWSTPCAACSGSNAGRPSPDDPAAHPKRRPPPIETNPNRRPPLPPASPRDLNLVENCSRLRSPAVSNGDDHARRVVHASRRAPR